MLLLLGVRVGGEARRPATLKGLVTATSTANTAATPHREGDITGATTRGGTKDTFLLEPGVQKTLLAHLLNKPPNTVVPDHEITIPTAATGVIA
jgi:hypothetical protein